MRLLKDLRDSLREPGFWAYAVWLDLISKNRRNRLGPLWLFAPTLILVFALGQIYSRLMNHDLSDYLPYLGVGYVHWRLLTQTINQSSTAFTGASSHIMDGRIRLTDYLLRMIAKAMFNYAFALLVIVAVMLWSPVVSILGMGTLVLTIPVYLLNIFWISVVLALMGARFPDMAEVVNAVMMFAFLLTPILWYVTKFKSGSTRGYFVSLNPLYHLLDFVRAPALGHSISSETAVFVACMTVFGWLLAIFLYQRYARFVPLWI
jgi:ABC-type polysaccharide/polyol phosphate export permease